ALVAASLAPLHPTPAAAQEIDFDRRIASDSPAVDPRHRAHLTAGLNLGALGRAVTGTIPAFGYDSGVAPSVGVDVGLLAPAFNCGCDIHHGGVLGFTHAGGRTFGLTTDFAYRQYLVDTAYTMRIELPCLSRDGREVFASGFVGISGQWADA